MNTSKTLSKERIAEILAFEDTDFSDCPIQTPEELRSFRPKHPENFSKSPDVIQINVDADIIAWFERFGGDYQAKINDFLRKAML
jgi:uncharacterized protein (DUF4415 family)